MPRGLGTFSERGIWLFPHGQGRHCDDTSCSDMWRRCSFFCCCCVGGLGGCDGSLRPPLPAVNSKLILYVHGGAFALTNATTYPWLIGYELVRQTGAVVLVPDYTRPPSVSFGETGDPVSDFLRLYERLLCLYGAENILVMGDSAGANIALATLFSAGLNGLPAPAGLVLFSPWVDITPRLADRKTWQENSKLDYLPEELIWRFASEYCRAESERAQPCVSPLFAPLEWFQKLPPVMLTYGTNEVLRSQQAELEQKLSEAGVLRALYVAEEMPHVAVVFAPLVWGPGLPSNPDEKPSPAVEAFEHAMRFAANLGFGNPRVRASTYHH
eukprot:TRINITY_DN48328_c0_g1_i1.p1 TRINITY_DN48328_c0_g1~~TRINITY_DN48328_c0_g1_i1.p1  ORF type:complete len:327 (+),score=50.12 TRINITY_DN48328_c0_g1_i1:485-1465(+)